jgi:hypothetical protein
MSERYDTTAIWQTFSPYKTKLPQPLQRPSGCHHRLVNMQRALHKSAERLDAWEAQSDQQELQQKKGGLG